jgi:hypothetical protein
MRQRRAPDRIGAMSIAMPGLVLLLAAPQAASAPGAATATTVAEGATQPHLAADSDGTFLVAFLREGNIGLAVSTDGGSSFAPPVTAIDARGNARGGMQRGPRVAVDGAGIVYVTAPLCFDADELAKRYPTRELYLAVSTDGGSSFAPPVRVNDAPKRAPEALHWLAAAPGGEVFVAWLDRRRRQGPGQDLAYALVSDRGRKVHANGVIDGPLCECCAPGVAMDPNGNPILVWREGGDRPNRALWIASSTDGGASFETPRRLNRGDSHVEG